MTVRRDLRPYIPFASAAVLAAAALVAGLLIGALLLGEPPLPQSLTTPAGALTDILESLDNMERRTAAVVEILNDMAAGSVSSDREALNQLRDSMQEITEELGDIRSQLQVQPK